MIDPEAVKGIASACADAAAGSDPSVYLASYTSAVWIVAILCLMLSFVAGCFTWSMR